MGLNAPLRLHGAWDGGWKYNPGDIMLWFNTGNIWQVAHNFKVYDVGRRPMWGEAPLRKPEIMRSLFTTNALHVFLR